MSTVAVVVIVIIVVVVLGVVGFVVRGQARRRGLQERFGPEYDRAVRSHESTREAEQELLARQKRHDELEIRSLDPEVRERYIAEWRQVQERFVDAPETAVTEADRLLTRVMSERGYPTEGFEQQVSDLSVEHAGTIDRYRTAHDISARAEAREASTEDLRQAMVHYRALFTELLDTDEHAVTNGHGRTADAEAGAARAGTARTEAETARTEAGAARTEADAAEPARTEAATDEPVAGEHVPAGATEREAAAEADTADRTETTAGARTRTGRRTARRDSEDEGA